MNIEEKIIKNFFNSDNLFEKKRMNQLFSEIMMLDFDEINKIDSHLSNKNLQKNSKDINLNELKILINKLKVKIFYKNKLIIKINRKSEINLRSTIFKEFLEDKYEKKIKWDIENFYLWAASKGNYLDFNKIEEKIIVSRLDVIFRLFINSDPKDRVEKYRSWLNNNGFSEMGFKNHVKYINNYSKKLKINKTTMPNIVIHGYISSGIGLGNYARNLAEQFKNKINVSLHDLPHPKLLERQYYNSKSNNINIIVLGLDQLRNIDLFYDLRIFKTKYNILIPFWELKTVPLDLVENLHYFKEIWYPSYFIRKSFDILRIQNKMIERSIPPLIKNFSNKKYLKFERRNNVFLVIADLASGFDRKNLIGVVKAFNIASKKHDFKCELVFKLYDSSSNFDFKSKNWLNFNKLVKRNSKIKIVTQYWSQKKMQEILSKSIALISLHRSEGLGLVILEAMSFGTPTIVTGYGGNMDFTTQVNSYIIDFDLVKSQSTSDFVYRVDSEWAEPNIKQAAIIMYELQKGYTEKTYEIIKNGLLTVKELKQNSSISLDKLLSKSLQNSKFNELFQNL